MVFKQNRLQEMLYSTKAYRLKDDPTFLQSHSVCNISSLFTCRCSYKVDVVRTMLTLFVQSCRCSYKVVVVCTKLLLFVQSCRCSYKVDVVRTKVSLFVQS